MSQKSSPSGKWQSRRAGKTSGADAHLEPAAPGASNATGRERAIWKGSISFGLVQIPVSIAVAERASALPFHQLDRHDLRPIGYERVNKSTGKTVPWTDIVRGYEISRGNFVVVTDEDLEKANVKATQTIEIQDFVLAAEIPPAFFDRPYHLEPGGKTHKAYAVLRDALAKRGLAAVALVVLRTRQHVCAVLPRGERLELELLRFASELRPESRAEVSGAKATPREVLLAEQLIESMVVPWKAEKYKDTYTDDLLAAIHEKAKTGAVAPRNVPEAAVQAPVDLAALLERSLKHGSKASGARRSPHAGKRHKAA